MLQRARVCAAGMCLPANQTITCPQNQNAGQPQPQQILPMENTRGRDLVEAGRLCERKNGRGVDTNRNWAVDWGVKEKDYDPAEEYPGRAPHSEPEVQVVLGEAKALAPHVWLNVHSGMLALFMPYDHKATVRARGGGAAGAGGRFGRFGRCQFAGVAVCSTHACSGVCAVGVLRRSRLWLRL